jgi:hypothetical protein
MGYHAIDHNVVECFSATPDGYINLSRIISDGGVVRAMDVQICEPEVSIGCVRFGPRDIHAVKISAGDFQIVDLPSLLASQLHGCGVHSAVNDRLWAGSVRVDDDGGFGGARPKRSQDAAASHSTLEQDPVTGAKGRGADGGERVPRACLGSGAIGGGGAVHIGSGCDCRGRSRQRGRGRARVRLVAAASREAR